ncbi:protein of unknown function [Legionella hackeliae]|uniref:Uncharacterized protein n=1 Tax=Legionella hackeliae TaxID=449 RepID=A0A0A8UQ72_LEGHA|nr:protein of unknown function [Legionella hackeliae]
MSVPHDCGPIRNLCAFVEPFFLFTGGWFLFYVARIKHDIKSCITR